MPDIVEVRLQIHVDDASLVLHNRLCHTQDGVMGRAFWAIAVPTRLEVRFKDGFQDELEGSLDHTVTDGRNREEAGTCAAFLRNRLVPQPHGVIRAGDQCVLEWLEEGLDPVCLTGLKRHPSTPWSTVVFFGQSVGFAERVQLADMDVPAPETPGRFSLRLGGYPPAQVWQTHGCLSHCTPASQVVEGVTNRRVPLLHGHYPASALLRTPPSPSRLRLISRWTGYTTYLASADFAAGRGGSLQLLRVSLSPCCRSHPAGGVGRVSQSATAHTAFTFTVAGSASGAITFGATCAFACATAWRLAPIPQMRLSSGFRRLVSRPPALRATGLWLFPWEVFLLLNTPAFAGHTTVRASFPAHGSSMTESLSRRRCSSSQRSVHLCWQQRIDHPGLLSSLPPYDGALSMGYPMCYWQLDTLSHRLHVSLSSGFPRGFGVLKERHLS